MAQDKPEAIVRPPLGKRVVATSLLVLGGLGLGYYGTVYYWGQPGSFILYFLALVTFFVCFKFYTTTGQSVLLFHNRVISSSGELLFEVQNIKSIDNGLFAFKPSNGALVHLHSSMPAIVRFGLWWRIGKRVGIGGCTSRAEVNVMVDLIRAKMTRLS
ncbi:MAG: hypothetical protein OXC02_02250 [Rhodobacteraceae bacterium]|nr:hypothetical protein [Paracoccaceae bacterium]